MKLQILGINYAPENISTAVYTTGLAQEMSRRGHSVTVVTAQPYYPAWRVMPGWPRYSYRSETSAEGVRVIHCPLYVPNQPSAKGRLVHYASFAMTSLPRALWRALIDRPDVMFVVAPSLVSAVSGWAVARMTGAKLWLHIQDFEVEAAFAIGAFTPDSKIGRAALRFERWLLGKFDRISTISGPMMAKLREKGIPASKTFELRNWANIAKVSVVDGRSPMRDELGIDTKYVAYYSGNVASKQGLEIIPAAARILADRTDLTFVICGEGSYLDELKTQADGLENIRFFPLQPLEKLSDALGMADVHLLPQIAAVADLVLPSKLTNMLASGRPVVATALPGTALANEVEGAGVISPPGDSQAFADAITTLLENAALRATLGAQARAYALERWDMAPILTQLENQLKTLITEQAAPVLRAPTNRNATKD